MDANANHGPGAAMNPTILQAAQAIGTGFPGAEPISTYEELVAEMALTKQRLANLPNKGPFFGSDPFDDLPLSPKVSKKASKQKAGIGLFSVEQQRQLAEGHAELGARVERLWQGTRLLQESAANRGRALEAADTRVQQLDRDVIRLTAEVAAGTGQCAQLETELHDVEVRMALALAVAVSELQRVQGTVETMRGVLGGMEDERMKISKKLVNASSLTQELSLQNHDLLAENQRLRGTTEMLEERIEDLYERMNDYIVNLSRHNDQLARDLTTANANKAAAEERETAATSRANNLRAELQQERAEVHAFATKQHQLVVAASEGEQKVLTLTRDKQELEATVRAAGIKVTFQNTQISRLQQQVVENLRDIKEMERASDHTTAIQIDRATRCLKFQIADLELQLADAKSTANMAAEVVKAEQARYAELEACHTQDKLAMAGLRVQLAAALATKEAQQAGHAAEPDEKVAAWQVFAQWFL